MIAFLGLSTLVFAQTKGTVNDANGFPESDIEVSVKGTQNIVYTDENGNFDIDAKVGDILVINGEEYIVTSNNLGVINPKKTSTVDLQETVVTAYGVQKKETVVGSNVQIKSEVFEDRALTNVAKALEGGAPGVQFSTSTGQPGSGANIRIRGISSYNLSNSPLFVVDGAIFTGSLSDINPNDIESFSVLKDASSTSLYGSAAANGVVMITTKKGKKGNKGKFTFSSNTGVVTRGVPEYAKVGAEDYYKLTWTSMRNGYLESNPNATVEQANQWASNNLITQNLKNNIYNVPNNEVIINGELNPNASMLYNDFDWMDAVTRVGSLQQYNLSYAGASDDTNYFASLGYNNEEGYIIKSDFERYNARVNVDSRVSKWLKIGTDITGALTKSKQAEDGEGSSYINPFYTARFMGPIYSPYLYDDEGKRMYDENGNVRYDGTFTRGRGAGAGVGRNVLQETLLNDRFREMNAVFTRTFAEFNLLPGLTFRTNVAYDIQNYNFKSYQNKEIGDAIGTAALGITRQKTTSLTLNQILSYQKSFGLHNLQVDLGHESIDRNIQYAYTRKTHEVVGGIRELSNFIVNTSNTGYSIDLRKESYFGRVNYDYNSTYSLSASVRQDQSSRFAQGRDKGTFWSAGAGWNIHKEDFLRGSSVVNNLKLRTSYGEVGNDGGIGEEPGYNADLNLYVLNRNNGLETGILLDQIGNPNLTWEKNKQFDLAVEFGLLNNRINGSVEYYQRRTDGMIFPVPTPGSAGVPGNSINANFGSMENRGIEISLDFGIVRNENLKWNFIVNASTIKNEMIKMPEGQDAIINGTKRIAKGRSIYDFWLREYHGVDSTDGRSLYVQDPEKDDDKSTRVIDGKKYTIDHQNAKYGYVGTSIPDLYGSFSNNVSYKGFYLNAMFAYQIGGKTYDSNYAKFISTSPEGAAISVDMLNAWKNPGDITNIPKMSTNNEAANLASSSRYLVKSDYLSLRTATFGYTFNKEQIEKLGVSSFKLFITGENLVSWTARKGMEPVQSFNGTTSYRYTPPKIWSVGVNVQF
ncbi:MULTISPECIES: SusC/RagA family TonB-linked outer membrane protein [unclassified Empedobacter]|uniref:SusC/RagA family TonB-linked outer membrane protein n=1 Tax=unclassified Empedobacter TaxID=2643773 RepID=UPI0025C069D5|nr:MULTISPECIES: SusC/RagA family TonB-linked outer membrane protein [unclassified Empedobacter]